MIAPFLIGRGQRPIIAGATEALIDAQDDDIDGATGCGNRRAGELAMVDFISSEEGLGRYLNASEPVAILFEDVGFRVFSKPPNLHLISTVGFLRGLQQVGVIPSADDIIAEMLHPSKPGRRPNDARTLTDLPFGTDEAAAIGSTWKP